MIASVSRQLRRCASTEKIRLWHFRPNVMRIAKVELRVCFGRTSQGANRKKTSEHRIIDRLPKRDPRSYSGIFFLNSFFSENRVPSIPMGLSSI